MRATDSGEGLSSAAIQGVVRLADAVLSLRPLVDVLEHPVEVLRPAAAAVGAAGGGAGVGELLDRVADRLGAPPFRLREDRGGGEPEVFTRVVSDRLDLTSRAREMPAIPTRRLGEVDVLVDDTAAKSFERSCTTAEATAPDGVSVRAYAAGDPERPPVVIASACGMPAKLCEPWMRFMARRFFVVTWESRGLFDRVHLDDAACGVEAQADDLVSVMDRFGLPRAHLLGICGGAVIALAAAAAHPDRASSLSLWHGDFDLGPGSPKTAHQKDLVALLGMATAGRVTPAALHATVCRSIARDVPVDLAHLVLYPYAAPDLLADYCRLNENIMTTDVRPYLGRISQPSLVVTSSDDRTAHPDGSKAVAAGLSDAELRVEEHGDHLSLFRGDPRLMRLATGFIARQHSERPPTTEPVHAGSRTEAPPQRRQR